MTTKGTTSAKGEPAQKGQTLIIREVLHGIQNHKRVKMEGRVLAELHFPADGPFGALTFEQVRAGIEAGLFEVVHDQETTPAAPNV